MKKIIGYLLGVGAFILIIAVNILAFLVKFIIVGLAVGIGVFLLLKLMEFIGFIL